MRAAILFLTGCNAQYNEKIGDGETYSIRYPTIPNAIYVQIGFRAAEKMFCSEWHRIWARIQGAASCAYGYIRSLPQRRRRIQRQAS